MGNKQQKDVFWRILGYLFLVPLVISVITTRVDFFPSDAWAKFTGFVSFALALLIVRQVFSRRAMHVIANSHNPSLLRIGQWALGIGLPIVFWICTWHSASLLIGTVMSPVLGTQHSVTLTAKMERSSGKGSGLIGCMRHARIEEVPFSWGHNLCIDRAFYDKSPRVVTLTLHGIRSPLGFKVESYESQQISE